GYVGRPMSMALQSQLFHDFGERIMFKPETPPIGQRLSELREVTNGNARVFEGSGGIHLVDSFRRGIVGTMPGSDLIWAIVAIWRALQRGDDAAVRRVSFPLSAIIALQTTLDSYLAVEKYLLCKQGVFKNALVRGPVAFTLDAETRAEVDRLFEILQSAVREQKDG